MVLMVYLLMIRFFAAGPGFPGFVAAATFHQLVMLGLNAYRMIENPDDSDQMRHYTQAVFNNLFSLGLLTAVTGAVVFVMISPVAPAVGSACALTAVFFTSLNIVWRIIPTPWKDYLKGHFELANTNDLGEEESLELVELVSESPALEHDVQHHRIFSKCDYSALVKTMDFNSGEAYLQRLFNRKIAVLDNPSQSQDDKNNQKAGMLREVLFALSKHKVIPKGYLLKKYPLAFKVSGQKKVMWSNFLMLLW